jgi:hypothetical protein
MDVSTTSIAALATPGKPIYIMVYGPIGHTNWDAALTLGTCAAVICWLSYRPTSYLYNQYKSKGSEDKLIFDWMFNFILGLCLMLFFMSGITAATILLGYWLGELLKHYHLFEGVVHPFTQQGLVQYHG